MFNGIKRRLEYQYYTRIKKMTPNEYGIMKMRQSGIKIGDRCFLGNRCILLPGVTLGENCIVGAGAVVTKSFPAHSVLAGNPARRICTTERLAEKYKDYAIDFGVIPYEKRNQYVMEHPEKWVVR